MKTDSPCVLRNINCNIYTVDGIEYVVLQYVLSEEDVPDGLKFLLDELDDAVIIKLSDFERHLLLGIKEMANQNKNSLFGELLDVDIEHEDDEKAAPLLDQDDSW